MPTFAQVAAGQYTMLGFSAGKFELDDEVFVGDAVGLFQGDRGLCTVDRGFDVMRRAVDGFDGDAGVDVQRHADLAATALVGRQIMGGYGFKAGRGRCRFWHDGVFGAGRVEPWADNHGKYEFEDAVLVAQRIEIDD